MEILAGRILKSDLLKIPEKERILFLLMGHLANELNILYKLLIVCFNKDNSQNEVIERAQLYQGLAINTILIGKIYEGWKLINDIFLKLKFHEKYKSLLPESAKTILLELTQYFSNNTNLINMIRHKFAFHYDYKKFKKGFDVTPNDTEYEIYLAESYANSFYYFSAATTYYAILHMINPDERLAIKQLFDEVKRIAGSLIEFIGEFMYVITDKYLLDEGTKKIILKPVYIGEPPLLSEVIIPYFVRPSKPKSNDT